MNVNGNKWTDHLFPPEANAKEQKVQSESTAKTEAVAKASLSSSPPPSLTQQEKEENELFEEYCKELEDSDKNSVAKAASNIADFGIAKFTNPVLKMKLAKKIIAIDPGLIIENDDDAWGIKNEKDRMEICAVAVKHVNRISDLRIKKYNISNQAFLLQLGAYCFSQKKFDMVSDLAEYLANPSLTEDSVATLTIHLIKNRPEDVTFILPYLRISAKKLHPIIGFLLDQMMPAPDSYKFSQIYQFLQEQGVEYEPYIKRLLMELKTEDSLILFISQGCKIKSESQLTLLIGPAFANKKVQHILKELHISDDQEKKEIMYTLLTLVIFNSAIHKISSQDQEYLLTYLESLLDTDKKLSGSFLLVFANFSKYKEILLQKEKLPLAALSSYLMLAWAFANKNELPKEILSALKNNLITGNTVKLQIEKAISDITDTYELTLKEKCSLLQYAFLQKNVRDTLLKISAIIRCGDKALASLKQAVQDNLALPGQKLQLDFNLIMKSYFVSLVGPKEAEEALEPFLACINNSRNPSALFSYIGSLKSLPEAEGSALLIILMNCIKAVAKKTYKQQRYDCKPGSHLEQLFKGREEMRKEWVAGSKPRSLGATGERNSLTSYLMQKFAKEQAASKELSTASEKDVKAGDTLPPFLLAVKDDLPHFIKCWKNPELCQETLRGLGAGLAKAKLPQGAVYSSTDAFTAPLFKQKLECKLIALLNPKNTPHQQETILKDCIPMAESILGDNHSFTKELMKTLENLKVRAYTIQDTDDEQDMLLIGTEISGSCQSVTGDPDKNKCLLGYIVDGKYRAIAVKDPDGKIVARVIMRLLWNPQDKVPVLVKERFYSNPNSPVEALASIDNLIIERARALQVCVVSNRVDAERRAAITDKDVSQLGYPGSLQSLGSPAPYEYLDIASGMKQGPYEITEGLYQWM